MFTSYKTLKSTILQTW